MENSAKFNEQSEVVATPQEQVSQEQVSQEQVSQEQAPQEQASQEQSVASAGVVAAQEFVAPLIQEAMNGNENAKDIIARTAGEVAAATNRSSQEQSVEQPVEQPVQPVQQPVQQKSNEEVVADEVVPPETGGIEQEKVSSNVSGQDILNAINLFR